LFQVVGVQRYQVLGGSLPFTDAVTPVWVCHELKLFVVFNQFIQQHISILVMHVVVSCTMDVKQVTTQVFGMCDG
jgi:hypothetical protein